ncbi:ABC transporter permease [Amycolatopsis sp. FDAARGOS 1241]|uniref:ABC transporter permease n=1 Tax=Amycolatopsis sp. FDAARGOS 1241 TaxID=2778070 RepID=UPI00194F8FF6|nr:ABC transporter permease [Amycolatopsis sp. FDAARGOS 1241]QRP48898.1 hypothetical protein I6J71_14425 [Amycolatopsis sp. FDAARGOS 1241]
MTAVEAKLFLRDPGAPITALGIPLALVLVFGLMPGTNQPSAELGGHAALPTLIAPMAVAILIGMLAVMLFPAAVATYREKGVLKRLSASPVPPGRLLAAQLLVNLAAVAVAILLVVGAGRIALGMALPVNLGWFAAVVLLGALALFSVGALRTAVGVVALFLVANGRFYYAAGTFPILWAAAAVHLQDRRPALWWRWVPTWPVFVLSALYSLPYALPVWPVQWLVEHPEAPHPAYATEEVGWPDLAEAVAGVYRLLPPGERTRTALVTAGYWAGGALDRYGPEFGLPEAYSGSRGLWYFGRPPDSADAVLFVGADPAKLTPHFRSARIIGRVENHLRVPNASEHLPIWLLTGRTQSWSVLWPQQKDLKA